MSQEDIKFGDKVIILFDTEAYDGKAVQPETAGIVADIEKDTRWKDAEWCTIKTKNDVVKVRLKDCWKRENAIHWTGEDPVMISDFLDRSISVSVNRDGNMNIDLSDFNPMDEDVLRLGQILLSNRHRVSVVSLREYGDICRKLEAVRQ